MNGHLPGAQLCPLDKSFNTVAGSFLDEDDTIYLVIDEHNVEEAVRDLIRIGLDNIAGYITPADLAAYHDRGTQLERIESIDYEQARQILGDGCR